MKKSIILVVVVLLLVSSVSAGYYAKTTEETSYCINLFGLLKVAYNSKEGDINYNNVLDFNNDKSIGLKDFTIFARKFYDETWCHNKLNIINEQTEERGFAKEDKTKEKERAHNLKIAVVGDTHAGYQGDNYFPPSIGIHTQIVEEFMEYEPDVVLHLGDVIHNTGINQWEEFDEITNELRSTTEYYPCIGNHDYTPEYIAFFGEDLPNGGEYYYIKKGPALFISLDVSNQNKACGGYANQKNYMIDVLEEYAKTKYKFVFFHLPLITTGGRGIPFDCWDEFHPIFEEHKVDIILMGHIHAYERFEVNGIQYVISGGGGGFGCSPTSTAHCLNQNKQTPALLPLREAAAETYNYIKVDIEGRKLYFKAYNLNGNVIDSFTIRK